MLQCLGMYQRLCVGQFAQQVAAATEMVQMDMRRQNPVYLLRRQPGHCDSLHDVLQPTGRTSFDYGIFLIEPYINGDEAGYSIWM